MDKINILDKHTSELIAAGEVVERPASVVKELVENSIDAGATLIVVEIKNGGISYIRVTDNGCGMSENDAKVAFVRHATSKIQNANDLYNINTMGFRGEALAAIAAVSKIELFTMETNGVVGAKLSIEGGKLINFSQSGCPVGCTIVVRDLFYNTPARLAFMKKDSSEGSQVASVLDKIALANPAVSIRFIKDGKEELFTAGDNNLLSVIYSVFGRDIANGLIKCEYHYNDIKVSGYISKPLNARGNRNMQLFSVNDRIIKSRLFVAALEEGYKDRIMTGKFPLCVLNVALSPKKIDVNVHPSKQEIKFSDEKSMFDAVYFATKNTLDTENGRRDFEIKTVNPVVVADPFRADEPINESKQNLFNLLDNMSSASAYSVKPVSEPITQGFNAPKVEYTYTKEFEKVPEVIPPQSLDYKIIGEVFNSFFIVEEGENLLFIDKHAAHERMLYEELKTNADAVCPQLLLSPIVINLPKDELTALLNGSDELENLGFLAEEFGASSIIIREVPSILSDGEIEDTIRELAEYFKENKGQFSLKSKDEITHKIACKAAIKAGKGTSSLEMESFIKKLLSMPDIKYCPHGRPIIAQMTKYQFEKLFKRIV